MLKICPNCGIKFWSHNKTCSKVCRYSMSAIGISAANRGRKRSPESIEKGAAKLRGRKRGKNKGPHRTNPGQSARLRINNPMFKEEHRAKLRKPKPPGHGEKVSRALKGKYTGEKSSAWKGGPSISRPLGRHTPLEWEELKKQHKYTCLCCMRSEPDISLEKDHIIPVSKGGSNFIENIQPLCVSCNRRKSAKVIRYQIGSLRSRVREIERITSILSKQSALSTSTITTIVIAGPDL
jgi:5-methylcytosine-specific restriction endonuclease McrA